MTNWYNNDEQFPVPTVLSDEECARIRFNLLNDDCMKLNDEDLCLFNNLSACSSSDDENYLARNPVACSSNKVLFCPACSATWHDCCCTEDYHCTDLTGHSGTYA